jgi:pyridoxal phosphate enzyme (YggS family)
MDRLTELSAHVVDVRHAVAQACELAGRSAEDVTIIAVTKTWPASDIRLLAQLGVTDVGENRDQEAKAKYEELAELGLAWHAIGQLQTNKAKSVAGWADVVHSVDRLEIIDALAKNAAGRQKPLKVLLQINLDPVPTEQRGGCLPEALMELAERVLRQEHLELAGVMGVAPLIGDAAHAFAQLQQHSHQVLSLDANATWISAGMSEDFPMAIKYGATHLRIGSLILGHRPIDR